MLALMCSEPRIPRQGGNLLIAPAHLLQQWKNEADKVPTNLSTLHFFAHRTTLVCKSRRTQCHHRIAEFLLSTRIRQQNSGPVQRGRPLGNDEV